MGCIMKRIKDIVNIPIFLNNQRYDDFYQDMSKKRLKKEVVKRHTIFIRVQDILNDTYIVEDNFIQDKEKTKRLNKKNSKKKTVTIKRTLTLNGVQKILPASPPKTKQELIQNEKKSIINDILGFTEPLYIDSENGKRLNYRSSDFTMFPGFNFDNSPIIIPIMSHENYQNLRNKNELFEPKPQNLEEYTKSPSIYLNLDFSDDAILEELRTHLTLLREQKNHKPIYLKSRSYLDKLKNFRILQVMDLVMWQAITDSHIQYDTLALFLYPHGQYTGKQLKETITPLAKNLLNSKSNESSFFCYIVSKSDEV